MEMWSQKKSEPLIKVTDRWDIKSKQPFGHAIAVALKKKLMAAMRATMYGILRDRTMQP